MLMKGKLLNFPYFSETYPLTFSSAEIITKGHHFISEKITSTSNMRSLWSFCVYCRDWPLHFEFSQFIVHKIKQKGRFIDNSVSYITCHKLFFFCVSTPLVFNSQRKDFPIFQMSKIFQTFMFLLYHRYFGLLFVK